MARGINQTISWTISLALSALIFGVGLSIVHNVKPSSHSSAGTREIQSSEHGSAANSDEHHEAKAAAHGAPEHAAPDPTASEHGDPAHAAPEHGAAVEKSAHAAAPETHGSKAEAQHGDSEDKEITPSSIKAKALPEHPASDKADGHAEDKKHAS